MRVVIVGASPLGRALAGKLVDASHDVVMIDRNAEKLDALGGRLDCGLIEGDGTLPSILREAGGDEPDALLALTNSDEDNILCAVVGRSVGYQRVIPQIIQSELCAICEELTLEDVITPHETVAADLLDTIEDRKGAEASAHLTGALRLAEYNISASMTGKDATEIDLGTDASVIAVKRGDEEMLARAAGQLRESDVLVIVLQRDKAEEIAQHLKSEDES